MLLISSDAVTPFPNRFIKSLKHSSIYRRSQCVCIILYDVIYCWGGGSEWNEADLDEAILNKTDCVHVVARRGEITEVKK